MPSTNTVAPSPHALALVVALPLIAMLLVTTFAWPAAHTEPRDVPVAVAAPAEVRGQLEERLGAGSEGALDLRAARDRDAALQLVRAREVYGAVVVTPSGSEVITASAASPTVAQLLSGLAEGLAERQDAAPTTVPVTDVVPTTAEDPRSAGLVAGLLPLVLAGIAIAGLVTLRLSRPWGRAVVAAAAAAVSGLTATLVLQTWLGSLAGDFWVNAATVALGVTAMATVLVGLRSLGGVPAFAVGAATLMLLGNPLSGATSAVEMLPDGWATLGQWLPPGALVTALRSVAFFDGAGAGSAVWILAGWSALGLVLTAAAATRGLVPVTLSVRPRAERV